MFYIWRFIKEKQKNILTFTAKLGTKKIVVSGFADIFLWLAMLPPDSSFFSLRLLVGDVSKLASLTPCFSLLACLNNRTCIGKLFNANIFIQCDRQWSNTNTRKKLQCTIDAGNNDYHTFHTQGLQSDI